MVSLDGVEPKSIAAWLDRLGLGQYAATFEAHALELPAVGRLSDADLQKLGVVAVDHRQRLLRAIGALPTSREAGHGVSPERRNLTVLFCDLADSTALSAQLDPEDLATLIVDYQHACAAEVAAFDGFVARYVGDGILAYFGYPDAHEDSAERAVRAALAIVQAIGRIGNARRMPLQVRLGIATGLVVVGSLPGSDAVDRHAVVGEAPNLASRLQSIAEPNGVVISASTYLRAGKLFECRALGPVTLRGFRAPVEAWQVIGERAFVSRFDVRRARGLTPYVGRGAELATLIECWHSARTGSGELVVIRGEAGIGKSRLVQELRDRLGDPHHRIDYLGSPLTRNSPLSPVIAQLSAAAGFIHDDSPEHKREKLDAMLAAEHAAGAAPILAALLSIAAGPHDPPIDPDAQRQKRKTLETIANRLTNLADRKPVVLLFEDVQWFDPTTLELLDLLAGRCPTSPLLMIVTARPEFVAQRSGWKHARELTLQRLGRDLAATMVEQVVKGRAALTPELRSRIVERSDGSPLYIEELTRAVLETSLDAADETGRAITIPDTLQDLLIARLHHAAPAREIAQIGAAIGRDFPQDLLEAVTSVGVADMRDTLDRLVESDLLSRVASPSGPVYVFKHALIQDAAYGTLLFAQRRSLHQRIAEALEARFPETVETQPELLAEHWERADATETAIHYWKQAGQRSAGRSAAFEADAHLRRALALIRRLPKGRTRLRLALDASVQHGGVMRIIHGPAGAETGKAFARARRLCARSDDKTLLVPALSGAFAYHFVRAENARAAAIAQELLAFAEARQDRQYRMIGHRTAGMVLVHTGDLVAARRHLEQSLALYDESTDGALASLYGTDHAQTAAGFLAKALWLLGFPDAAAAREDWSMAHAAKVNHLFSLVQNTMFRITVRLFARDFDAAAQLAAETLALAKRHTLRFASTFSSFCLAACRTVRQADPGAVEKMRAAAEAWGPLNYRPLYLALIAEAQAHAGDPQGGLRTLEEAQAVVEATDERWVEPELNRLRGELALMRDPAAVDAAEAAFRHAILIAQRQQSRSLELRASVSLARLWQRSGRRSEARELLAPIYGGFTEGFDTPDLREARSLLAEL